MCYIGKYKKKLKMHIFKAYHSSDCFLKLGNMKWESLVIVYHHGTVNAYSSLVHTARHTMGIVFV